MEFETAVSGTVGMFPGIAGTIEDGSGEMFRMFWGVDIEHTAVLDWPGRALPGISDPTDSASPTGIGTSLRVAAKCSEACVVVCKGSEDPTT